MIPDWFNNREDKTPTPEQELDLTFEEEKKKFFGAKK